MISEEEVDDLHITIHEAEKWEKKVKDWMAKLRHLANEDPESLVAILEEAEKDLWPEPTEP